MQGFYQLFPALASSATALGDAGINIGTIFTLEIKIAAIVDETRIEDLN